MATTKKKKPTWQQVALDIGERCAKTFIQALGGGFITLVISGDASGIQIALMAAVASALSVAWNAALAWANR